MTRETVDGLLLGVKSLAVIVGGLFALAGLLELSLAAFGARFGEDVHGSVGKGLAYLALGLALAVPPLLRSLREMLGAIRRSRANP